MARAETGVELIRVDTKKRDAQLVGFLVQRPRERRALSWRTIGCVFDDDARDEQESEHPVMFEPCAGVRLEVSFDVDVVASNAYAGIAKRSSGSRDE